MEKQNKTINIVKGVAIFLVVFGHVIQNSMIANAQDFYMNELFRVIYSFHMPLFIFISGYLIAFSINRKSKNEILKSRIKGLLIPFISWTIIAFLIKLLITIITQNGSLILCFKDFMRDILIYPAIWFLYVLFILTCLFLIAIKLQEKFGNIAFIVMYLCILIIPFNEYFGIYYIKWFYPFYIVGYFFNKYNFKFSNKKILIISFICFVFLLQYWSKNDYIYINKMQIINSNYLFEIRDIMYRYIIAFTGILFVWNLSALFSNTKISNIFINFGTYSIDIYLLQRYIVELCYAKIAHKVKFIFTSNPISLTLFYIAMAVISIYMCIYISMSIFRKYKLLNKYFIGNR